MFGIKRRRDALIIRAIRESGGATTMGLAIATGISLGAIYSSLGRLEQDGLVTAAWDRATPVRGMRKTRVYFPVEIER